MTHLRNRLECSTLVVHLSKDIFIHRNCWFGSDANSVIRWLNDLPYLATINICPISLKKPSKSFKILPNLVTLTPKEYSHIFLRMSHHRPLSRFENRNENVSRTYAKPSKVTSKTSSTNVDLWCRSDQQADYLFT